MAVVIPNTSPTQTEFHDTEINETNLISEVSSASQSIFEKRTLTASISKEQAPANPDTPGPYRDSTESGQKTLSSEIRGSPVWKQDSPNNGRSMERDQVCSA